MLPISSFSFNHHFFHLFFPIPKYPSRCRGIRGVRVTPDPWRCNSELLAPEQRAQGMRRWSLQERPAILWRLMQGHWIRISYIIYICYMFRLMFTLTCFSDSMISKKSMMPFLLSSVRCHTWPCWSPHMPMNQPWPPRHDSGGKLCTHTWSTRLSFIGLVYGEIQEEQPYI